MTTADRVDFRTWPSGSATAVLPDSAVGDSVYVGKHRGSSARALSLLRLFYKPRHRAR